MEWRWYRWLKKELRDLIGKLWRCFLPQPNKSQVERNRRSAMAEFPGELVPEILECLPVKSVLRFRCLSKSLLAIIDSPDFTRSHLRRSSQNINLRKLIFKRTPTEIDPARFHVCDMNSDAEEYISLEQPKSDRSMKVYGYCNGLILLYGGLRKRKIALWNPSILKYMSIPDCPFKTPEQYQSYAMISLGFGYDDYIDDYKVVLIVSTRGEIQVWIYGMRSKIWRSVDDDFPNSNTRLRGIGYFAGGSLHWLCSFGRRTNAQSEIIAFDVIKETFSLFSLPFYNTSNQVITDLHVLEGRLCISFYSYNNGPQAHLYMRKKKDGFDEFIWEQLYSIQEAAFLRRYSFQLVKVLGYSKTRKKILLGFEIMNELVSYDVEDRSVEMLDKIPKGCKFLILCTESLVWF